MKTALMCVVFLLTFASSLSIFGQVSTEGKATNSPVADVGKPQAIPPTTNSATGAPMIQAAAQDELASVANWLQKDGVKDKLLAEVSEDLGMGGFEVDVRRKSYESPSTKQSMYAAVSDSGSDIFFSRRNAQGNGVIFLASRKGQLRATVTIIKGVVKLVPNDKYASVFEEQKKYFLEQAAKDAAVTTNSVRATTNK